MKNNEVFKQNEEAFGMNIIEMPEQLNELLMSNVKGGSVPVKECCDKNNDCNKN